ncbi:MAG TPA: hypothetical protein VLX09_05205 [Stellaceae bacterium]|nr:hypothetical protein [Stellaceae bacterium]
MGQRIDQFCENLRLKLTNIDSGLTSLKAKIDGKTQQAEQEARGHLEKVRRQIQQNHAKVSAAQAEMKEWAESRKAATAEKIAEWKVKRETSRLQNRADKAERYAAASIEVALAAVDDAEEAALEAWLARQDAGAALAKSA